MRVLRSPTLAALALAATAHLPLAGAQPAPPDQAPGAWRWCDPWTIRTVAGVPQAHTIDANGQIFFASTGDGGPASQAGVGTGTGIAAGPDGSIYFCATASHVVRRITPAGIVERVAGRYGVRADYAGGAVGDGGQARDAALDQPLALAVDVHGTLYIRDSARVRVVRPDGTIRTLAGSVPAPKITLTAADLPAELARFRYRGPATGAVFRQPMFDTCGSIEAASDGTVYLHTDLGIQKVAPDGTIAPLVEGGTWSWSPGGTAGSYRFVDIALDGDALYAVGSPNRPGMTAMWVGSDIYRVGADGMLARVLGSDDSRNFNDPDGWNVGPNVAGKAFTILGLHFDAGGRMWFQSPMDGAHFIHLDRDGVLRWSGAFQTHDSQPSNVAGGPAPLDFRQHGPLGNNSTRLPDGRWAMRNGMRSPLSVHDYPVVRVLDAAAPGVAPVLTLPTTALSLSATAGGPAVAGSFTIRNTGTMFGRVAITSDQPWLHATTDAAKGTSEATSPFAAGGTATVSVTVSGLQRAGTQVGRLYLHLLGTKAPPQVVTVTVNAAAAAGNLAPRIVMAYQHLALEDTTFRLPLVGNDDGLPTPGRALSWSIEQQPAHGTARIEGSELVYVPPAGFNTMNALDAFPGDEQIKVVASDGALTSWKTIIVHVGSVNDAPSVDAGPDRVASTGGAALAGTASDPDVVASQDGTTHVALPLQARWSVVSGPGTVTFADAQALATTATFSAPGIYRLRLLVDDTVASASDTMTVTVPSVPGASASAVASSAEETGVGASVGAGSGSGSGSGCGMGSGIALLGLAGVLGLFRRRRDG